MPLPFSILRLGQAMRQPGKVGPYLSRRFRETFLWNRYYAHLREPKTESMFPDGPEIQRQIVEELRQQGFQIADFQIDVRDLRHYLEQAAYQRFPNYLSGGRAPSFLEKSLEHYLAAKLLELNPSDIYIDIASLCSPVPEIYHHLYGCTIYKQDLIYPSGLHGNCIGGDAANMPVENGFATKMALHCSFEEFEGDADMRFIREASRVLRPGGRLCIVPLYLSTRYMIVTNPVNLLLGGIPFEPDALLYCRKGSSMRHGRAYSVPRLVERVKANLQDCKLTVYVVRNEKEVAPSCYAKFIALIEKPIPMTPSVNA